jgi:large subunit ribosomal protein L6
MKNFKKKYSIKVPKNIKILYCNKKNLITFIGPLSTKSLNLKTKLFLIPSSNLIVVTDLPSDNKSKAGLKNGKKLQGTMVAKIKQNLIETSNALSQKLNLVGVGYRVFPYEKLSNQIYFKLGYSHLVYFRIPSGLNVNCFKFIKLLLFSNNSYDFLTQTTAQIRACKLPEPYKGKGILYDKETIILKKGKKI